MLNDIARVITFLADAPEVCKCKIHPYVMRVFNHVVFWWGLVFQHQEYFFVSCGVPIEETAGLYEIIEIIIDRTMISTLKQQREYYGSLFVNYFLTAIRRVVTLYTV